MTDCPFRDAHPRLDAQVDELSRRAREVEEQLREHGRKHEEDRVEDVRAINAQVSASVGTVHRRVDEMATKVGEQVSAVAKEVAAVAKDVADTKGSIRGYLVAGGLLGAVVAVLAQVVLKKLGG